MKDLRKQSKKHFQPINLENTGGEGFVALYEVDDIVRHLIVSDPRHILDIA